MWFVIEFRHCESLPFMKKMNNFNKLDFQLKKFVGLVQIFKDENKIELLGALEFAKKAHAGQGRYEGTPYILHPVRAAIILLDEWEVKDKKLILAALFHDLVEDTKITLREINKLYGERVAGLVKNLTRARRPGETKEEKGKNKVKKFDELMKMDKATRLVKCADLLDNIRSWKFIAKDSPARQKFNRWRNEGNFYAIPLAEKTNQRAVVAIKKALAEVKW